jgi:hypothetical protein
MPLDVVGQHAQEHMGFDPFILLVEGRTDLQAHGLELPEPLLHFGQLAIRGHGLALVEYLRAGIGAND